MVSFRRYRRLLPSTLALCFTVVSLYGLIHSDTWEGLYRHLLSVPQTRNNASAPHTRNNGSAPQTRDNASAPQTRKGGWGGETEDVMSIYLRRLEELTVNTDNVPSEMCPADLKRQPHRGACFVQGCNASFPRPKERLQRLIQTQFPIDEKYRALIDSLAGKPDYADLVFITAASANHFDETQGLAKDLLEVVFPRLRQQNRFSFHFYFYDLGLNKQQLKQAHLRFSSVTLWMDASVRFRTADITPIVEQARRLGVLVARNNYMMAMHVHPAMLTYFHVQPCQLAPFYETAGGFVAVNNDGFVQAAVVDPWVACAFSPQCLCPSQNDTADCYRFVGCGMRDDVYFRCHRFDQSALGIILATLFDRKVTGLTHELENDTVPWFAFKREDRVNYFPAQ